MRAPNAQAKTINIIFLIYISQKYTILNKSSDFQDFPALFERFPGFFLAMINF